MSKNLHSGAAGAAARPTWIQLFDEFMATMGQTEPSICDAITANSYLHMAFIGQVRSDATSIAEAVALIRAEKPTQPLEFIVPVGVTPELVGNFANAGVKLMTPEQHIAAHPEQHPGTPGYAVALAAHIEAQAEPQGVALGGCDQEGKSEDPAE